MGDKSDDNPDCWADRAAKARAHGRVDGRAPLCVALKGDPMASSTQRALATRAIHAAGLIEYWSGEIEKVMVKQNINTPFPGPDESVTLKAKVLKLMFSDMLPLTREIRELERNLKSETIRWRK
jgi:hypothetical protein